MLCNTRTGSSKQATTASTGTAARSFWSTWYRRSRADASTLA